MDNMANLACKNFKVIDEYSRKFGFYSVATLLLKYFNIVDIINSQIKAGLINFQRLDHDFAVSTALALLQDHYKRSRVTSITNIDHSKYLEDIDCHGYTGKKYDKDFFRQNNNTEFDSIASLRSVVEAIIPNTFYIYSIDKNLEVKVCLEPFPLEDIILGKRGFKVTHPHLVQNDDLIAICAGEVIFIKNSEGCIKAVIINNKSGHFRPSKEALTPAKIAFSNALNIPLENVICVYVER